MTLHSLLWVPHQGQNLQLSHLHLEFTCPIVQPRATVSVYLLKLRFVLPLDQTYWCNFVYGWRKFAMLSDSVQ